jgi:apolipoprotein N-acyltransferase
MTGILFMGFSIGWFWKTLPLDFLGISSVPQMVMYVLIYWGTVTVVLSLFVGLWGTCYGILRKRLFFSIVWGGAWWIFFEYARMWGFALFMAGEGAPLGPHFSAGFLGYAVAANQNLLQLAAWGGVYTLSFVAVAINILLAQALRSARTRRERTAWLAGIGISLLLLLVPLWRLVPLEHATEKPLHVGLVTTYFSEVPEITPQEEQRRLAIQKEMVRTAAQEMPPIDMLVFPEDSRLIPQLYLKGELGSSLRELFGEDRDLFVAGSGRIRVPGAGTYSRLFYYDLATQRIDIFDKMLLVPQGEYTPAFYRGVLTALGQKERIEAIAQSRSYTPGDSLAVGTFGEIRIGGLFCFEIFSPSLYRTLVDEHQANVLINLASHAWFHDSRTLFWQTRAMAKVHAVNNRKYFLQATNGGPSYAIDPRGSIVAESAWGEQTVLSVEILP